MSLKKEHWTIGEMLRWGQDYLAEKQIESPRLTMELLLTHVTGLDRLQLYISFEKPLSATEKEALRPLLRRRVGREPLQYIIGKAPFWGSYINVAPGVLIPRPETELLVEAALDFCRTHSLTAPTILDIGSGSGCIALTLAKELPQARVVAIDTSEEALAIAQSNASAGAVRWQKLDILSDLPAEQFDIILSNPPYISTTDMADIAPELVCEPSIALTDNADGLSFFRRFAEIFPQLLPEKGFFAVECAYNQAQTIAALFQKNGLECAITKDLDGIERVVSGTRRISG